MGIDEAFEKLRRMCEAAQRLRARFSKTGKAAAR